MPREGRKPGGGRQPGGGGNPETRDISDQRENAADMADSGGVLQTAGSALFLTGTRYPRGRGRTNKVP